MADKEKLQLFRPTPSGAATNVSRDENLMKAYSAVADLNTRAKPVDVDELPPELTNILSKYPNDWLIRSELLKAAAPGLKTLLNEQLRAISERSPDTEAIIHRVLQH